MENILYLYKMDYLFLFLVSLLLIIIGGILFFVFYKPPTPTPGPNPQPKPTPRPPSNSWPMEKEVFFVKVSNNPIVWDIETGQCVTTDFSEHLYATMLDYIRMYQGYKIASLQEITDAVTKGLSYNNDKPFDLYTPKSKILKPPIFQGTTYPVNITGSSNVTIVTGNSSNFLKNFQDLSKPIETSTGEIIYPIIGYKPIRNLTDAKDMIFMRLNREEKPLTEDQITYLCTNGIQNYVTPSVIWSANVTSNTLWFQNFINSMEILQFNSNSWSYYGDEVITSNNMTEGKELFLVLVSNPLSTPTLNPGYSFGTLDQFRYSAAQGANNCIDGWLQDSSIGSNGWVGGMHSNTYNPNGLISRGNSLNSGNRQQRFAQSYGTNNWNWVEPYAINMTEDGYCTQFSVNELKSRFSNADNEVGYQDAKSYYTVAENVIHTSYNPKHYFVWGIKPKDPKIVSPNGISIEPFMILQSGSKYSMYD